MNQKQKSGIFSGISQSIKQKFGGFFGKSGKETQERSMTIPSVSSFSFSRSHPSSNNQSPNTTTSSGGITESVSKRPFNIQLSEDDKDIYNLNEDDEGEDEEFEINEELFTDQNSKEPQIKSNTGENSEELTSSRSNNIPVDIENKDKNKMTILKESEYIHRIRRNGTIFDLREISYFNIIREREKSNILSTMGFDTSFERINYLLFFEEKFLYFSQNAKINKSNTNMRCIESYIDLFDILNISIEENGSEESSIRIELVNQSDSIEYNDIEFTLSSTRVSNFISKLNDNFQRLNIKTTSNNYSSSSLLEEDEKEKKK